MKVSAKTKCRRPRRRTDSNLPTSCAAYEVESGDEKAAEKTRADTLQVPIRLKGIRKDNGLKACDS